MITAVINTLLYGSNNVCFFDQECLTLTVNLLLKIGLKSDFQIITLTLSKGCKKTLALKLN